METLAVRYRPKRFEDVCAQGATIKILEKQLELRQFKNAYLFVGPSGVGKTTLARIFANGINNGRGTPIEIDAASNNGVDNVKSIVASAQERALDGEYKIYIVDECHMITTAGWNAFLKCIEEPPQYTIFIFCTTDVQKVPNTITNRVQKFNLTKIDTLTIRNRLENILKCEIDFNTDNFAASLEYIAKLSQGSMRQAISYLEKCLDYSREFTIDDVFEVLGNYPLTMFFDLTNMLIDRDSENIVKLIDSINNRGLDLRLFIDNYLTFVLDLSKYCLFKDLTNTQIPNIYLDEVKYVTDDGEQIKYFLHLQDSILSIKNLIKYDTSVYTSVVVSLLNIIS